MRLEASGAEYLVASQLLDALDSGSPYLGRRVSRSPPALVYWGSHAATDGQEPAACCVLECPSEGGYATCTGTFEVMLKYK